MSVVTNQIFLPGEWTSGKDVRDQNVSAAVNLASIVRTTLGPTGLDKMLVDDIGEVTVTNDGATILQKLEVQHPAAKVLVELSNLQDKEVGDGTTSVVLIASEFLKRANQLIGKTLHPTTMISGFNLALKFAINYIEKSLSYSREQLTDEVLMAVATTSMSSKIIGLNSDFFARMVVEAIKSVEYHPPSGGVRYPVKAVGVLKALGGSATESVLVKGFALNGSRASMEMPSKVTDAKIALLDFNLQQQRLAVGTQILITDPTKLEGVRQMENDITKRRIDILLGSGANVIITTGGIDDMAQKYLTAAGVLGVRRARLDDVRRIAKITGGTVISTLADMEGEESFDPSSLGHAMEVVEERVADDNLIFVRGNEDDKGVRKCGSLILRGPNTQMVDEVSRSVHDALCAVSRTLESGFVVCGGGAVECALAVVLREYALTKTDKRQIAIKAFADSLLTIPKQLAVNAALDSTELVAELVKQHHMVIAKKSDGPELAAEKKSKRCLGLDLRAGVLRDNKDAGVFEPMMSKIKSLSFATEAAVTILRIDDTIILQPEQKGQ